MALVNIPKLKIKEYIKANGFMEEWIGKKEL
jgi:hypothetical protein